MVRLRLMESKSTTSCFKCRVLHEIGLISNTGHRDHGHSAILGM